ncbi:AraC family transcriptional regulator [Alphaproteobacteria bacterium]|nr:AraC family transcriptional regulator [Alphaproteobacteria bacterium]
MSLARILDEMEVSTHPFAVCELQGKCELGVGRVAGATLHYVLSGEGEIVFENHPPVHLQAGSLVLIPAFQFHTLRGSGKPSAQIPECLPAELGLEHFIASAPASNDRSKFVAICSQIHVTLRGSQGLVDLVQSPLVETRITDHTMTAPFKNIIEELSLPQLGSQALVRTLILQCMIQLFRTRLVAQDATLNWVSGLSNERLWKALQTMLDQPGDPHSVESLADVTGMSRSTFAKHFSEAYGAGPMDLLRKLRMRKAADLLANSDSPVKRIAEMVGFSSRSAFNRAFIKCNGKSPRELREEMRKK